MPNDLLTTIRAELDARLSELRPLLDEYHELRIALDALGDERPAVVAALPVARATTPAARATRATAPAARATTPAARATTPVAVPAVPTVARSASAAAPAAPAGSATAPVATPAAASIASVPAEPLPDRERERERDRERRVARGRVSVRGSSTRRAVRPRVIRRPAPAGVRRGRRPAIDGGAIDGMGKAILAALEHGSHTVAELGVVTALPASEIRESLRRLLAGKAIVKTERDGRTAYALPAQAA